MSWLRKAIAASVALSAVAALGGPVPLLTRVTASATAGANERPAALNPAEELSQPARVVLRAGAGDEAHGVNLTSRAPADYISSGAGTAGRGEIQIECSPLATPEGEPLCGPDYVDTYNGGCWSIPEAFQPINCAEIVRGQVGTFALSGVTGYRDTDWYQIVLVEPTRLTWGVQAEFPLATALIDGSLGCDAMTTLARAEAAPCKTATIERCVGEGTYWLWVGPSVYEGLACGETAEYCAQLTCEPCTVPAPLTCPPDAMINIWQLPYGEDDDWGLFVSNDRFPGYDPANGVLLYDYFAGNGGTIRDIHWWGVGATYDDRGDLVECLLEPGNFQIQFWLHDEFTNRPDYVAGPAYVFAASGAELTKIDTGHVYRDVNPDGSIRAEYRLWSWGCDLSEPLSLFRGWITVQNTDLCAFWWAASPGPPFGSGGIHVEEDEPATWPLRRDVPGDLSYCLTSDVVGPWTGACCDTIAGICRLATSDECVGVSDEFYVGLTCDEIGEWCQSEPWACCSAGFCTMETEGDCAGAGGDWYRFYVCSTTDPHYDPTAFGGLGNRKICVGPPLPCTITCETPAAFSRALSGGYLYISWDRGPGDQRYVIDSFTGWTGSTNKINKVKWWGNSTIVWDGPDCDFDFPAPFVIKFYHSSGGGPNWAAPAQVYDAVNATWIYTGYNWTGSPELGSIDCYYASLNPTYYPGSGTQWISIASKTEDCDFIWAPGPDGGTPGQWFIDNGPPPGPDPDNRHRSFCLHTNIATGACCNELTGVCTNGVQEPNCLAADGKVFYKSTTCSAIPAPGCTAHTGACCNHNDGTCTITLAASCTGTGKVWLGMDSTCAECCVVLCPPGGIPEGEPPCGPEYVDTFNMGCFTDGGWSSQDFVPIDAGEIICGQTGTFAVAGAMQRDMDFYKYEFTGSIAVVQAKVTGEFQPDVWLMAGQCYMDPCTEEVYVLVYSQGSAGACHEAVAAAGLAGPNYYYIIVSCLGEVPCGTPYTLQVDTVPGGPCVFGEEYTIASEEVCLALGGTWCPDWYYGACCVGVECSMIEECLCGGRFLGGDCMPGICDCGGSGAADANCDGVINTFDIDPFVMALTNPWLWQFTYPCDLICAADCNNDGVVNAFDIDPFVLILTGGGSP